MTKIRCRPVLLGLAGAALLVSVLVATSYSAHADSSASAGRMSAATSQGPGASDTPCNFMLTLKTCQSTDPAVAYYDHATGDTSHCTFVFKITWGDGHSTTKTVTDPTAGSHLVAKHNYAAPAAYTIKVTPRVTAGTCTATSSVHTFTLLAISTPNYAGYSFYQPGGYIKGIAADWTVPAVTCPATGQPGHNGTPRAAIWAGLWGKSSSLATDWLPQIGTDSQCAPGGNAYYVGDFEMETNVADGGGWSYVLGVPVSWGAGAHCFLNPSSIPSTLYSYLNCPAAVLFSPFTVTAGDHIEAEVDYLGKDTRKPHEGDLIFKFTLRNKTRSELESFDIETTKPVDLPEIIYQGGGMLEDHNDYGGLAKFGPASLQFASLSGTGSGPFDINMWVMTLYGTQLATTGRMGAAPSYPFKVTFDCNGCLANGPCPPNPPCTKY
jgi:hypothetical protein